MRDLFLSILGALLGGSLSWLVTYRYFKMGGSARSRLAITLSEVARIAPSTVGIRLEMKVGSREVPNLLLFDLTVRNRGPHDIDIADAVEPGRRELRPRIVLPTGIRAVADPWNPEGSTPRQDVRVARTFEDTQQLLHIHVHRLASDASVSVRIVCTYELDEKPPLLEGKQVHFFPGFLPNVDVQALGLLAPPPALLER
jgi:hypothetical protein